MSAPIWFFGELLLNARLVAFTQQNPALHAADLVGVGDLATIWDGKGTYAENIVEFAGRVCYRSTHRMGTAPEFIAARVREGHEDIIEHIWATVEFTLPTPEDFTSPQHPLRWRLENRHCEVTDLGDGRWLVSGNLRVWLDLFRRGLGTDAQAVVRAVAPAVFDSLASQPLDEGADVAEQFARLHADLEPNPTLIPVQDGQMRVTLLGYTQPINEDNELLLHHGSATFLFEGISRTCTHQLVRHRLASFSQESQRYVDLSKGDWSAIVPPPVAENVAARAVLDDFWTLAEDKYAELRKLGIRKEDARFLLPNAAETRIVTSMNFAGWSHFFWLRAVDKAAQWEIRAMGQHALRMLHEIAPGVFADHWREFEKLSEAENK